MRVEESCEDFCLMINVGCELYHLGKKGYC